MAESLDLIPVTRVTATSAKHKKNAIKDFNILSMAKDIDVTEEDGFRDEASPMPSSVPNFLSKTYEIVNVSSNTKLK